MLGPSVQFLFRRLRYWLFLIQPPRIASFFKLLNCVIGDCKPLLFIQPFFQASDDLAGAPKRIGDGVPEDLSLRHEPLEHKENKSARRYILSKQHNS
jgi:hypothetical protein